MIDLKRVSDALGYSGRDGREENWIRLDDAGHDPSMAYIYRRAHEAGVEYAYVFQTSPASMRFSPARPALYFGSAESDAEADELHHRLWLLGHAPFIIVVLPGHVRVYTGFDYQRGERTSDEHAGLLYPSVSLEAIAERLQSFQAEEIDSGRIWERQAKSLKAENRVDHRLLANLEQLGNLLVKKIRIKDKKLATEFAHNLIGKYLYIHYLRDREILTPAWLLRNDIRPDDVFGVTATVSGLRRLTERLEARFNGGVFPLSFADADWLSDEIVSFVAGVFDGTRASDRQLALDFKNYDFSYIPIELLSSIYEQFLRRQESVREIGAYYTPEPVADYLVSELNYVKPLKPGMRILDPCCGSGIFLVLAYRRLIEMARANREDGKLSPDEISAILQESIYGVERKVDACYVTEFSLILTLLSYVEPPDLDRHEDFRFPHLHDTHIFCCDFFEDESPFWRQKLRFDWVVGNPPWVELPKPPKKGIDQDAPVRKWIQTAIREGRPVARGRVSDAFCWRATDLLKDNGNVGLLIPAQTLTNDLGQKFRAAFFTQNTVNRITNFSNLRYVLFAGRAKHPAATFVYSIRQGDDPLPSIMHYGPFVVHQKIDGKRNEQIWAITFYESDIKAIDPSEFSTGHGSVWKLALWGNRRDLRILPRLKRLLPKTLKQLCEERKKQKVQWELCAGLQLRSQTAEDPVEELPVTAPLTMLDTEEMIRSKFHFSVPQHAIKEIPSEQRFIYKRDGTAGLHVARGPHIFLTVYFAAFSDIDFILPKPKVGISATIEDRDYLRAVSILLSSSLIRYALFFESASWGIRESTINKHDAETIPLPNLTQAQIQELATLHTYLCETELYLSRPGRSESGLFSADDHTPRIVSEEVNKQLQIELDEQVERILEVPEYIRTAVHDFTDVRYQFNEGKRGQDAVKPPTDQHLLDYGYELAQELDDFVESSNNRHKITLIRMKTCIACQIEYVTSHVPIDPVVMWATEEATAPYQRAWQSLNQRFSQWVYIQRSLRWFDGETV